MRNDSIPLHPEFGVNPTLAVCVWCGKERGEVALLGNHYRKQAPMRMILDYEPCEACRKQMESGFVLIEASSEPLREGQPPMQKNPAAYPTGNWWVITHEAADRMFGKEIAHLPKAFIDRNTATHIGLYTEVGLCEEKEKGERRRRRRMKQAIVLSTQDLSLLKRGRTLEIHLGSETLQLLAEKSTAAQRRNLRNLARARKVLAKKRRNGK